MIAHLMELVGALAAVALLAAAAFGAGGWVELELRDFDGLGQAERAALRLLAGLGAIGLVIFLVGQVRFSAGVCTGVLLGGLLLNLRFPPARIRAGLGTPPLHFALAIVVLCALGGLDRPVGDINSDQITYHLLGPVVWLREQRIRPILEESLTAFPATVEVLFAAVRAISNPRASGVVGAVFFAVLLLQIRGLARHLSASPRGGDLAAAFFAGMPALTSTIDCCFVDVPYAAFVLGAARLAFGGSSPRHFASTGVFAGFAAGTKYFALPAICLLALLVGLFASGPRSARWHRILLIVGCSVIAGGAWYLRNWVVLGNPIYPPPPLAWRLFPTPTLPLEASEKLMGYIVERGAGLGKGPVDLMLLPFRLTYRTAWFHGGGGIGLSLLAFAPIGLALSWRMRSATVWAAMAGGLTLFWFWADQELRFLDAALAMFAAFAGLGGDALLRRAGATRWLATLVVAISLFLGAALAVLDRSDRLRALLSPAAAEARYQRGVPHRAAFAFLNSRPEIRKVLITHPDVPAYYLEKDYTVLRGRWGEKPHAGVDLGADPARTLGCTHILDVDYYGAGFRSHDARKASLVYSEEGVRIFEVAAPAPGSIE